MKRFRKNDAVNIVINVDWPDLSTKADEPYCRIDRATGETEFVTFRPGEVIPLHKGDRVTPVAYYPRLDKTAFILS